MEGRTVPMRSCRVQESEQRNKYRIKYRSNKVYGWSGTSQAWELERVRSMGALSRYGAKEEGGKIGTVEALVHGAGGREGLDTIIGQTRQRKPDQIGRAHV